jgi:hypothetical protein
MILNLIKKIKCIFGLADDYPDANTKEGAVILYELYQANLISKWAYSFWINYSVDSSNKSNSMFFMGGSNPDYYHGPLHFVPYDWGNFVFNK